MITIEPISSPIADSVLIVILQRYKVDDFKIPEITQKPSETCLVILPILLPQLMREQRLSKKMERKETDFWKTMQSLFTAARESWNCRI